MKKAVLIIILVVVGLALVAGGIALGFALNSSPSTPTPATTTPSTTTPATTVPSVTTDTDKIVGTWKGEKSILVASITMNAEFKKDGTALLTGKVTSKVIGNYNASIEATWEKIGTNTYKVTANGASLEGTCDGKTISFTVNPYKFGLIKDSVANIDLNLSLDKV